MDKPENHNRTPQEPLPDLAKLSLAEVEALIARKRLEESRKVVRDVRARSPEKKAALDELLLPPAQPPASASNPNRATAKGSASRPSAKPVPKLETMEERFRPTGLEVKPKKPRKTPNSNYRLRNIIGYTLEAVVIIAVLVVVGNWLLQQWGISINLFSFFRPSSDTGLAPSRLEGPLLIANAPGAILVKIPVTIAAPAVTLKPEGQATPLSLSPRPTDPLGTAVLAASPTVEQVTPTVAPTATPSGPAPVVAPTPTPVIVQPKPAIPGGPLVADNTSSIVARRLVIPRLGIDSPVKEVTVDLGTWQVADFAVGHHLGTANPGQVGNMVLAGHRDIRGSVFLRLNEMRVGDEFSVFTDNSVYRYLVINLSEVAPTQIEVMSPTPDATATLITCTPVGLATRRLIIKAKLET